MADKLTICYCEWCRSGLAAGPAHGCQLQEGSGQESGRYVSLPTLFSVPSFSSSHFAFASSSFFLSAVGFLLDCLCRLPAVHFTEAAWRCFLAYMTAVSE